MARMVAKARPGSGNADLLVCKIKQWANRIGVEEEVCYDAAGQTPRGREERQ